MSTCTWDALHRQAVRASRPASRRTHFAPADHRTPASPHRPPSKAHRATPSHDRTSLPRAAPSDARRATGWWRPSTDIPRNFLPDRATRAHAVRAPMPTVRGPRRRRRSASTCGSDRTAHASVGEPGHRAQLRAAGRCEPLRQAIRPTTWTHRADGLPLRTHRAAALSRRRGAYCHTNTTTNQAKAESTTLVFVFDKHPRRGRAIGAISANDIPLDTRATDCRAGRPVAAHERRPSISAARRAAGRPASRDL
ncbi:MAG: hypothetical protein JWL61_221 [Gemmatimonadetes bacterium]|nr:hypothetical protein [Gemmatimonadota bacterium]